MVNVGSLHPRVCIELRGDRPCPNMAAPGSDRCTMHRGTIDPSGKVELQNYRLNSIFGKRAAEMATSPHLKSLTDELVLNRVALETIINKCESPDDMLIYNDRIMQLTNNIRTMMESIQKLQERNKELIDRQTLFSILETVVAVIANSVHDPDVVGKIGAEIYEQVTGRIRIEA